jgi:membrane fusion protein, multidrug efflux system
MREPVSVQTASIWPLLQRGAIGGLGLAAAAACSTPAAQQTPVLPVRVAIARRAPAPLIVTANGQIDPLETARVVAQVSGLVTDVTFREGDLVRQGQVLFRINPRPYADVLAQAQAAYARDTATAAYALRNAERLTALARQDYVAKSDADAQASTAAANAATVASDLAAIRRAQFDLTNTLIRAPISGRTGSLLVYRGNFVQANPDQPLVAINRIDPVLVRFNVPATSFADLQIGGRPRRLPVAVWSADPSMTGTATGNGTAADSSMGVTLPMDTTNVADARGTLTFVDNAVDTTTGTVRLKAVLANRTGRLWPGQFVFVSLQLGVVNGALLVPSQAVELGQKPAVYVVAPDGQAARRPVTLGANVGSLVIVTSGLAEGERVITDGQSRLRIGARVRVASIDSATHLAARAAP